ncbi:MAG: aldehyde ferredoxin oxidoreductase family protein [Candidatus Bathyarchaeota archaeon]|nr:MAG: aldehyde ferredoxin oxidoreductase family protein [Candidatus Bathyarchaeota archaeon]
MTNGFNGTIFRVNLSSSRVSKEHPDPVFYRRYLGGWGFIAYYLLNETKPHIDPLGPDNKLIIAPGVLTGAPIACSGRGAIGAKSPLTGGFGAAEGGGFFCAELKHAGCDGIIVEGQSKRPIYLWIHDGALDICPADALWGLDTGDTLDRIREEQESPRARAAMIGGAGEKLARIACIMDGEKDAYGRNGMGAVMGSKRLKAVAARGTLGIQVADREKLRYYARKLANDLKETPSQLHLWGTGGDLTSSVESGNLPTRNFRDGEFPSPKRISSMYWKEHGELIGMEGCYACTIRCKKVVKISEPWEVDPRYGGPEYETEAALGSNCGIEDEKALFKGNELCNRYGLDTIQTGAAIAFAMECYENGLLSSSDTGGLDLRFGNGEAMVAMVKLIGTREGLGDLLADGVKRAAATIGKGADQYAVHVKGQEVPMHEPRLKRALGVGYAVSPTGADHVHNFHDTAITSEDSLGIFRSLGLLEPLPLEDLGPRKVQALFYRQHFVTMLNSIGFCWFYCFQPNVTTFEVTDITRAVTGWDTTTYELMTAGKRMLTMARMYNLREGFTAQDDWLPPRFFHATTSGPLKDTPVDPDQLRTAIHTYYEMMGWDKETGVPSTTTLHQLDIGWTTKHLP